MPIQRLALLVSTLAFAALPAACSGGHGTPTSSTSGGSGAGGSGAGGGGAGGSEGAGMDGGPNDGSSATDATSPPACGVPFSPTGPWCYKLPPSTPVASSSAAIVANIKADIKNNYGTFGINTDTYSTPIYVVAPGTPKQSWGFDDCQHQGSLPPIFAPVLQNVPSAPGMVASMGTDAEITIYDPAADQEWEFWVATQSGGHWSACWGGTIQGVSQNPGIFPSGLGATASGLPLLGFVIRISELQAGLIQHAINIAVVRTQAQSYSWPANRTDGNTADPDTLMEGQRVRLDPTFDVSTLPNAAERTIAKAMQDYGMLLTDTSGSVDLQAEDPRPYEAAHQTTTNPYDALFDNTPSYSVLADIPIDRFQVLPKDYGQGFMH